MFDCAHATVVVVDDDLAISQALEILLESAGYGHRSFASAEAFLDSKPPPPPCCMILDYRLPGMSGIELQSRLARRLACMPVLLLSAGLSDPDIQQALRNGAYACMHKPFDPDDLLARIADALKVSGPDQYRV